MSELIQAARQFACSNSGRISQNRHAKQQTFEAHLKSVAQNVSSVSKDEVAIAAAWLHDIVEDTSVTLGEIRRRFGKQLAALIQEITPASRPGDGDRNARFAIDKQHFAKISPAAKLVKLADLIDTCRDLRAANLAVSGPYLAEAAELLPILEAGDSRLAARLRKELKAFGEKVPEIAHPPRTMQATAISQNALRTFERAFSARDIAEPLLLFHGDADCADCRREMRSAGVDVAAIWKDGTLCGYLDAADSDEGPCAAHAHGIAPRQLLESTGSLTDVIETLTRYDWCFVTWDGEPRGLITRADVQKPAVRMWLFGIITVAEMEFTARVRQRFPGESWAAVISPPRLEKARHLLEERERRKEKCQLVDCLQLGDKMQILMSDVEELAAFGIPTVNAGKRASAQIEMLRNKLAHSQDFVDQDWPIVVRLARRIEELVRQF